MTSHEYAFDITLNAVARVQAATEEVARKSLVRVLDAVRFNVILDDENGQIRITEASAAFANPGDPVLFEIDGAMLNSEQF